jgi:hypothetical protein
MGLAMRYLTLLMSVWLFSTCLNASAANSVYVAQKAIGAGDGTSAANAYGVSYFNDGSNWNASPTGTQIGPGTVVHLCGSFSSPLTVQGSGAAGNSIKILFERNASMIASSWVASGAAITCNHNYIVIDGGTNGLIAATNQNSTSRLASFGISCTSVTNVEVKNLRLTNIYNKTDAGDPVQNGGTAISFLYGSNLSAHDNLIANVGAGIFYTYLASASSSNISLYRNTISGCNWGIASGSGGAKALLNNFQIYANDITMPGSKWDDPDNNNHHNGNYVWAEQDGSRITNLKIYSNYVHGDAGAHATAFIYVSANARSSYGLEGVLIFNNLLVATAGGASNGCIFPSCNGFYVYNNTIVALNIKGGLAIREFTGNQGGTSGAIQNNIFYNWDQTIYGQGGVTTLTRSKNLENVNPLFVNGTDDFHLTSASPARNAGINLSGKFDTDKDGNVRPQTANWCAGAYEYKGGHAGAATMKGPLQNLPDTKPGAGLGR